MEEYIVTLEYVSKSTGAVSHNKNDVHFCKNAETAEKKLASLKQDINSSCRKWPEEIGCMQVSVYQRIETHKNEADIVWYVDEDYNTGTD